MLAGLAAACAPSVPPDVTLNPNLTRAQRDDVLMLNYILDKAGMNFTANLDDFDGNGQLDLIYTGPEVLKNPGEELTDLAQTNGYIMARANYPIDKLIVKAGPDVWTATFQSATDCYWGKADKDQCTVEKMWKRKAEV